jgi:hypothetical protein
MIYLHIQLLPASIADVKRLWVAAGVFSARVQIGDLVSISAKRRAVRSVAMRFGFSMER